MNSLLISLLFVGQVVGPPSSRIARSGYEAKIVPQFSVQNEELAAMRRVEFERRYQALAKAMNAFAAKYNDAKGNIWPIKEAAAVRKAFRDLEKLEPAFEVAQSSSKISQK